MTNTCTIDYFLIMIFIIYENHSKMINENFNNCFEKIHDFVGKNNWNFARLQWLNFAKLKYMIIDDCTHNWFGSEFDAYYHTYSEFQRYSWTFECNKGSDCKNNERHETSSSFILK